MLLLHAVMGQAKAAEVDYNLLVHNYPSGKDGFVYAELASAFWQNYQASKNIQSACQQAIQFAGNNEHEVFYYVGNIDNEENWHGEQSHQYEPEDVCPFQ